MASLSRQSSSYHEVVVLVSCTSLSQVKHTTMSPKESMELRAATSSSSFIPSIQSDLASPGPWPGGLSLSSPPTLTHGPAPAGQGVPLESASSWSWPIEKGFPLNQSSASIGLSTFSASRLRCMKAITAGGGFPFAFFRRSGTSRLDWNEAGWRSCKVRSCSATASASWTTLYWMN